METALDKRTEKTLATLTRAARQKFRPFSLAAARVAAEAGCQYVAIGGTRTWAEQDALYERGRGKPGPKVTNARGGSSWHNFGVAVDFGVFRGGRYLDEEEPRTARAVHAACGKLAAACGLEWGGDWETFKDPPHYHVAGMGSLAQMRRKHPQGKGIEW